MRTLTPTRGMILARHHKLFMQISGVDIKHKKRGATSFPLVKGERIFIESCHPWEQDNNWF
ncbi:hypothetical protein CK31_25410 [Salmonella enterica subsp. enterica]|uniref:Uncharacterized protein n=1 Tax=Salmonella enterica I TaxID=59201 RepID=A0A7Z1T3K1_SALET|nr:hypothetical protein [Salmonella enterica]EAW1193764.1 hypothetical protein [Salmonella enterica subsp. enterica]EDO3719003.1 hypothetical protein [Salmonella enterica]OHF37335.1 hypothetical protein A7S32_26025 [Salmonella enterica subsp. diarizonae serovar 59:[k]:z35]PTU35933.1 hypothetical protein DBZ43_16190 [Salmonella enterica subsp. enterica]